MGKEYDMDPTTGEARRLELERHLQNAKTADFGVLNSSNKDMLKDVIDKAQGNAAVGIERLTDEDREAIKVSSKRSDAADVHARRTVFNFMNWLSEIVNSMFAGPVKKTTQCKIYGHVLPPPGSWHGDFPLCQQCGVEITSPDQIRGALPKDFNLNMEKPKQ